MEMRSDRRFLPRSPVMAVVFLAFNGGMLWWFEAVRATFDRCARPECPSPIGLAFVMTTWALGTLVLGLVWFSVEHRLGLRELEEPSRID